NARDRRGVERPRPVPGDWERVRVRPNRPSPREPDQSGSLGRLLLGPPASSCPQKDRLPSGRAPSQRSVLQTCTPNEVRRLPSSVPCRPTPRKNSPLRLFSIDDLPRTCATRAFTAKRHTCAIVRSSYRGKTWVRHPAKTWVRIARTSRGF